VIITRNSAYAPISNSAYFKGNIPEYTGASEFSFGGSLSVLDIGTGSSIRAIRNGAGAAVCSIKITRATKEIANEIRLSSGIKNVGNVAGYGITYGNRFNTALSFRYNNADGIRSYLNGIAIPHSNISTVGDSFTPPLANNLSIPYASTVGGMGGNIYYYWEINKYLTAAEHLQLKTELDSLKWETSTHTTGLHDTLINNTYYIDFMTKYGAFQSTASRGGIANSQLENTPFFQQSTTGRYKISTDTHLGQTVKVIECVTGGAGHGLYVNLNLGATGWQYYLKKSGETVYTYKTDNAIVTASGTKSIFAFAAGDKIIYSCIKGDCAIRKITLL